MGFWGSFIAAIAMFLPSGVLTIMCSKFILLYSGTPKFKAVLKGVHAIAVGMIYAAVYKVGIEINLSWQVIVIVVLSAILLFKFKLNAVYIIPISAILGHFIFRL
jgi:chromate transporter